MPSDHAVIGTQRPTDGDRFRFLADHELSVVWYDSGASIHWREKWPEPGKTAGYRLLSRGHTLAEAVDQVIERYNRKHGRPGMRIKAVAQLVDGGEMDLFIDDNLLSKLQSLQARGRKGKALINEVFGDDWGPPPAVVRISGETETGQRVSIILAYD